MNKKKKEKVIDEIAEILAKETMDRLKKGDISGAKSLMKNLADAVYDEGNDDDDDDDKDYKKFLKESREKFAETLKKSRLARGIVDAFFAEEEVSKHFEKGEVTGLIALLCFKEGGAVPIFGHSASIIGSLAIAMNKDKKVFDIINKACQVAKNKSSSRHHRYRWTQ